MTTDSLKQICHALGGLLIMLMAFIFYDNSLYRWEVVYLCLGFFFILVGLLAHSVTILLGRLGLLLFLGEAAALLYAAVVQQDVDDFTLTYAAGAAAFGYIALAFYFFITAKKRVKKRSRKSRSIALL